MNFREWSNPNNWDDDGNPRDTNWGARRPSDDDEWSNPDNWDEDGEWKPKQGDSRESEIQRERAQYEAMFGPIAPNSLADWAFSPINARRRMEPRPVYTDEETIDLMMDRLERQFPVEFDESDKQFLHSVGMTS